jgi:hypothetical protein
MRRIRPACANMIYTPQKPDENHQVGKLSGSILRTDGKIKKYHLYHLLRKQNFHEPLREESLESYSPSRARSVSARRYSDIIMCGNGVRSTLLKIVFSVNGVCVFDFPSSEEKRGEGKKKNTESQIRTRCRRKETDNHICGLVSILFRIELFPSLYLIVLTPSNYCVRNHFK